MRAIACLHHALKQQPNFVEAWHNLGCMWMMQGDMSKAQDCFEQAIALKPDFPQVHGNLGHVLEVQTAVHLATHPVELTAIRQRLQDRKNLSLFQPQAWLSHLEATYWQLWGKTL